MDWVMCLLPFAVCFLGFLAAAKVTKKKKRVLAVAGAALFFVAAFSSLAVYRYRKITKPIRDSELLAVAELKLDSFRGNAELNDFQVGRLTELYGALEQYLNSLVYLPCINQDTFDGGSQDVILQFGTDEDVKLWLAFYPNRRICLVNGKKAYVFPDGKAAYQKIEELFETESVRENFTIVEVDREYGSLQAVNAQGDEYTISAESSQLRTVDGKSCTLDELQAGDVVTVLWDGNVLMSYPYQIINVYRIYKME